MQNCLSIHWPFKTHLLFHLEYPLDINNKKGLVNQFLELVHCPTSSMHDLKKY